MRYLFTTLPTNDLGLLARSLPIARELAKQGHTVAFCSPAPAPSRLIAEAGFDNLVPNHPLYDLLATDQSLVGLIRFIVAGSYRRRSGTLVQFLRKLLPALPRRSAPRTDEVWNMDHAGAMMGMVNQGFVRANCDALSALIAAWNPDVVVDFWNPLAVIAARRLRKPLVTVIQSNAHPASDGFIWWKPHPADLPTPAPTVNRVLAAYGLPAVRSLAELCVGDLTLVVGTPETDPLPASADVTYIGPALWQDERAQLPAWIGQLPTDRPLIWVYSGNPRYAGSDDLLDSAVVLRASVAALAREDAEVVVTTGHHPLPHDLLPLPANMHYEAYVPGLAMAKRADLLIHHGGYGSCQTALYAGKPSVIVPTYSERESNARRIAALGAGLMVPVGRIEGKKHVDVEQLRAAIRQALTDRGITTNAQRLSARLREYGGAAHAAGLIEQFSHTCVSATRF